MYSCDHIIHALKLFKRAFILPSHLIVWPYKELLGCCRPRGGGLIADTEFFENPPILNISVVFGDYSSQFFHKFKSFGFSPIISAHLFPSC